MKIECVKEKLNKYISIADKFTSKNTTLPILNSVLLIADNEVLKIRATNLEIGVEFNLPAKIKKNGNITIPSDVFNNTLSCLPNEKNLSLNIINENLEISTINNKIIIKSQKSEDFPTLPKIQDGEFLTIPIQKIIEGVKSVKYSAAISDIKPEISSIFIHTEDNMLVFTATDSFRLAEKKIIHNKIKEFTDIIIPFKNINEIIKVFDEINKDVDIILNKNQISFSCDDIYITSRLINGIFPDYKQIIPKEKTTEVVVLKQDLIDSFKLINIFSDKFNKVNIKINPNKKIFEINSKNEAGENTTNIKAVIKGDEIQISFNYKYIIDCFQSISSDSITLIFNGENKPMVVKGVGDNSFIYIIMPINK